MKRSIIMTVYNRPQLTLMNTLSYLGLQDLDDTEILVVDDGSDLPYEPLLEPYGRSVRYERIDTAKDCPDAYSIDGHNNPAHAYNKALELAQGDIVCFMSSDTLVPPGCISAADRLDLKNVAWMPCVVDLWSNKTYLGPDRLAPFGWFFATHRKNVEAVKWDENYMKGIAFEDNDFMARLALHLGRFVVDTGFVAWHQSHHQTAYSDEGKGNEINRQYTLEKWGAIPWHPQTGPSLKVKVTNLNTQMVLDVEHDKAKVEA